MFAWKKRWKKSPECHTLLPWQRCTRLIDAESPRWRHQVARGSSRRGEAFQQQYSSSLGEGAQAPPRVPVYPGPERLAGMFWKRTKKSRINDCRKRRPQQAVMMDVGLHPVPGREKYKDHQKERLNGALAAAGTVRRTRINKTHDVATLASL